MNKLIIGFLALVLLMIGHFAYGAVASSTNYQIQRDAFGSGGVDNASSSNYLSSFTVGEQGGGRSTSTNYTANAGFQQFDGSFLSVSAPGDVALGSLVASSGTSASSSAAWTVTTNNNAGYQMTIKAANDPALRCSGTCTFSAGDATTYFEDFNNGSTSAVYAFTVGASESLFGYTVTGSDTVQKFLDNGSACNQSGGTANSTACWTGLSTTTRTIAQASSDNSPSGTATTVYVRSGIGSSHAQDAGSYSAVITVTATAL